MLGQVLADLLQAWRSPWSAIRRRAALRKLRRAVDRCADAGFDEARALCERALALAPDLADAWYLLGIIACHGGAPEAGVRAIERALDLAPGNPQYLAALGDAQLLQQRPDAALALYGRAFPGHAADIEGLNDANLPWRRAHPDWTRSLLRVTLPLPLPPPRSGPARDAPVLPFAAVAAGHLLNWALVLISRRRVRQAIHLLQQAVERDPALGYGYAVLALLHTLNRDWQPALAAALAARRLRADAFSGATDLCILAAQFGAGTPGAELDPVFDWSALIAPAGPDPRSADRLPRLEGLPFPAFPQDVPVYFVACDPHYFFEYGIALACSIHEAAGRAAIHFHLYNPTPETWTAWAELRARLAPLALSATWESVEYDRFGGKGPYCGAARFSRLYQLLLGAAAGTRIAMLDADSLVRGDPAAALARGRDIGLAHAANEPFWHQYLAGFTTFRASPAACRFLQALSCFLATNLTAGKARTYMDQIALYACVYQQGAAAVVDLLPAAVYCDTLFEDGALIWSVTQKKGEDTPFDRARRSVLDRYCWPGAAPGQPAPPAPARESSPGR